MLRQWGLIIGIYNNLTAVLEVSELQVQWYPGHMAKARRMLIENLKLIDVVVEIVDARTPLATRNPDFEELFKGKKRTVILNKSDLADSSASKQWIERFNANGMAAAEFVSTNISFRKSAAAIIENAAREMVMRMKAKGVNKTVRAMIVGIPNVGKSTFINCIAGKSRAMVGDRPGVTKGKQWVKITPYLEIMDTPGLLWPKLDNELYAHHLAFIGSINDDILDTEALARELLEELMRICPNSLNQRYSGIDTCEDPLDSVCKARGFVLSGGGYDTVRAARTVLDEFRSGKIARVTLELPETDETQHEETR